MQEGGQVSNLKEGGESLLVLVPPLVQSNIY